MRISDWSSDVCSSDLGERFELATNPAAVNLAVDGDNLLLGFDLDGNGTPDSFVILEDLVLAAGGGNPPVLMVAGEPIGVDLLIGNAQAFKSEEHTSELQSLMRISYAVFCLKKKQIENKYQGCHVTTTQDK